MRDLIFLHPQKKENDDIFFFKKQKTTRILKFLLSDTKLLKYVCSSETLFLCDRAFDWMSKTTLAGDIQYQGLYNIFPEKSCEQELYLIFYCKDLDIAHIWPMFGEHCDSQGRLQHKMVNSSY